MNSTPYTAGSLFTGIGGIDLAFAAARFDIRFQVEIGDHCRKVLSKHAPAYWPNAAQHVDIRDVGRAELGFVNVLFGGFPCQDISSAGKGAGLEGARSGLWYEFRRIIGEIRPDIVFVENVPAITSRGGTAVIAHLAALGFDARWGIVGAADAGAPHQRDRWFCLAYSRRIGHNQQTAAKKLYGPDHWNDPAYQQTRNDEQSSFVSDREIVAYADSARFQGARAGRFQSEIASTADSCSDVGNSQRSGRSAALSIAEVSRGEITSRVGDNPQRILSQSRLGRNIDGLSDWLDRPRFPAAAGLAQYEWEPERQIAVRGNAWGDRLRALGNAVIPAVIYPFAVEISKMLDGIKAAADG